MSQQPVDVAALSDLCTPWCIRVAATLRIAHHLEAGPARVDALAAAAHCDADHLRRLLRHLVRKGIFAEPEPDTFALNDAGRELKDEWLGLDGFGGRMAYAWGGLLSTVRTGRPAYAEVFGRPFWEDLDAHQDIAADFDAMMGPAGHGTPDPDILVDGDWTSVRTVVDAGGGTGAMLAEILRAHPDVRGILLDLPATVARSGRHLAEFADRATTVGQSFFDPLPAGADVYLLKNLLADWPDTEATAILRRCAEAARPGGRVVVLGGVAPDGEPVGGDDLLMMVLVGGKERGLGEFRALAADAGLAVSATGRQAGGRFVVECRPT